MDAKTYFTERDGKVSRDGAELNRVAIASGVTPGFLYMVALRHKPFSPRLACDVEHATSGYVDRRDSLPEFPWDGPAGSLRKAG